MRELAEMNFVPDYFSQKYEEYKKFMVKSDYVISVQKHHEFIESFIIDFH